MSFQSHQEFSSEGFNFSGTLEKLRHYLPDQAPLMFPSPLCGAKRSELPYVWYARLFLSTHFKKIPH
jgi:hypothetical protein